MKFILLFALALPMWACAADVAVSRCWQPDGPFVATADIATKCPPQATDGVVTGTTTDTQYTAQITTTATTGTVYWYTVPNTSSCPQLAPSRKSHISGSGALHASTSAITAAGNYSKAITGLNELTNYCTYALIMRSNRASNRLTIAETTEPTTPGGGGDATGLGPVTYIVDSNGGSDGNTGLSYAQRLATIAAAKTKVEALGAAKTSADICLMTGSSYVESLTFSWSGTLEDPVLLHSCYRDTSNANAVTSYFHGSFNGRGAKAIIGNETNAACVAAATCTAFGAPATIATNQSGQILISQQNHIQIIGLKITYTAGRGIIVEGAGNNSPGTAGYVRIAGNDFAYVGTQAVLIRNGASNWVVENNDMTEGQQCNIQARRTGVSIGSCLHNQGWGGMIEPHRGVSKGLIENNDIYNGYSEGIVMHRNATSILVRGNRIGNTHSSNIYCDMTGAQYNVIESNITWGVTNGGSGSYSPNPFGGMGAVAVEESNLFPASCIYRNNIAAGSRDPAKAVNFGALSTQKVQAVYLGNTFIDSIGYNLRMTRMDSASGGPDVVVAKSNIFANTLTAGTQCQYSTSTITPTMNYNLWSLQPSATQCRGGNDPTAATPTFAAGIALSAWRDKNYADRPTVAQARLASGASAGIGVGDPGLETSESYGLSIADFGDWIWQYADYPFSLTTTTPQTNWLKDLYYDYEGTARHATTPDAGALEF